MSEKNVTQRLLLIGLVLVFALSFLRDPSQTLRPGLDIAGGTSLIFEIDTKGAEQDPMLAERVKEVLQRRVDPKGVYDLSWRVHGRNRLEVQMPLPPTDAKERRNEYARALADLFDPPAGDSGSAPIHEITRGRIERALRLAGTEREQELYRLAQRNAPQALARLSGPDAVPQRAAIEESVQARYDLLLKTAANYDAMIAAQEALRAGPDAAPPADPADTQPATRPAPTAAELDERYRDAQEAYEDALYAVLDTNLSRRRFQEVLELDPDSAVRAEGLSTMRAGNPDLVAEIDQVVATHAEWRSGRRFLDGPGDLKRLLRGSGKLEFRILAEPSADNVTKYDRYRRQLTKEGIKRRATDQEGWFKIDNPMQFFNLQSQGDLEQLLKTYKTHERYVVETVGEDFYVLAQLSPTDGLLHDQPNQRDWKLTWAIADRDQQGRWCVRFRLDPIGGQYFERLTSSNIDKPLCILVDDTAYSAPNINSAIRREGEITGDFSLEKVQYLVRTMEGGMLPARLKDTPLSERTVGSSLGETNRDQALRAGLIGAVAVAAVMWTYYLIVCGSIANIALTMNVLLILSAMAMLQARITLVGIAGIILSVGMAVDANVLIFERMREEKQRGTSLRMIIKNGYDKALSTIFDSNITTLLTCMIIYYVGSEEVKGFGLTLGWGIVLNLFTSVFVTRTLFALLVKYNLIKDVKMLQIIGVPTIDWYAKRKIFIPISLAVMALGLFMLYERGPRNFLDVEFLGGVAAEFELKEASLDDADIRKRLSAVGEDITAEATQLANASLAALPDYPGAFTLRVPDVDPQRLAALITEPLESANLLERNGVEIDADHDALILRVQADVTEEALRNHLQSPSFRDELIAWGRNLGRANVNAVLDTGGVEQQGLVWNLTTTVTNMRLVEHALVATLGENMRIQPRVSYEIHGEQDRPFPITDRLLEVTVPDLPTGITGDLTDYLGGTAFYLDQLTPPQSAEQLEERLRNMLFQPDFQDMPQRPMTAIGITPAEGTDENGNPLFSSIVVAAADPDIRYSDNPDQWLNALALPQQRLIDTALSTEQTLRKVMQFKPQIAARSTSQAALALLLSWGMIIGYLWIRFGRPMYGVAGVVALIHDALIALAFVGISGWETGFLLIDDFKINMTIVAALLTIIGYSINDTIVVFDRIRETRGRLGVVTPEVINASINQTLSRTIMTSFTTLVVLVIMYIFGGGSIRGFNYCMIVGIVTGSYSSIAVAAPLLMLRFFRQPARG